MSKLEDLFNKDLNPEILELDHHEAGQAMLDALAKYVRGQSSSGADIAFARATDFAQIAAKVTATMYSSAIDGIEYDEETIDSLAQLFVRANMAAIALIRDAIKAEAGKKRRH